VRAFPKVLSVFAVLFSLAALPASAQQVSADVRAVPSKATVGDEIRLMVRVERPKAYDVEPPSDKLQLAPFELKRVEISPVAAGTNRVTETFTLIVTAFQTGELTVPSFTLAYVDGSGRAGKVPTPTLTVKIESVAGNLTGKEDIKPIKGPVSLDFTAFRTVLLGSAAGLLSVLLIVLVVRRLRRRPALDPETLLPPHERAMLEFERLQKKGWLEAGEAKAYYAELADILRRYLGRRFGIEALDLTSTETVAQLKAKQLPKSVVDRVRELFETADSAKFAKQVPASVAGERARASLLEFVESTRPVEEKGAKK
jgi:hypothetical protein